MAVDPRSGDLAVGWINSKEIHRFGSDGTAKGAVPMEGYPAWLRFDRQGNLYVSGGHVFRLAGGRVVQELGTAAGDDLYAKGIDVDGDGNLWVVSGLEAARALYRIEPGGRKAGKVADGPDWRLGALEVAQSVRIDAAGQAYVAESGEEGQEAARISVFDRGGAFVRAFGRGGRAPVQDGLLPGQVWRPVDLAFGPAGRVYVACAHDGGFSQHLVLMFQPF